MTITKMDKIAKKILLIKMAYKCKKNNRMILNKIFQWAKKIK